MKTLRTTFIAVLLLFMGIAQGTAQHSQADSVTISLLTAGPGDEVWSLYGHTAIRYHDLRTGEDLVVNYGMFSFQKSFFIARFVLGLTDYEMGITTMDHFINSYGSEGRWVYEQVLNLTREEKLQLTFALNENYLPENRVYRYNYFYNNCTTKAREMIINHLNVKGYTSDNQWSGNSYREMTHQWTTNHRWTRFGNDLLLGVGSDLKTQREASFFLPDSVRKDFDNIILTNPDGTKRKLVAKATWLIHPKKTIDQSPSTFVTPQIVFGILFAIILMLTIYQWRSQRSLWLLDTILLIATGLAGIILFIMIFSQHPTVRINLQILLLNPLSLIFAYHVAKAERKGLSHWYWRLLLAFLALFFIGGIFQDYAEGMCWLGLTMLTRSILSIKNQKLKTKN